VAPPNKVSSLKWGEAILAALCAPAMLGGVTSMIAIAMPPSALTTTPSFIAESFDQLLTMSPVLVLVGAVTVVAGSLLSVWLPGRRRVKLGLLVAGAVAWTIGFALLSQPGLIDLP
jgi:hypothetical protein